MDNEDVLTEENEAAPVEKLKVWITARYVGAGSYWPGVPARDLTVDEWAALSAETKEIVLHNKLYRVLPQPVLE